MYTRTAVARPAPFTVLAPSNGAVVDAGSLVRVAITPAVGTTLTAFSAWFVPVIAPPPIISRPPFELSMQVPGSLVGDALVEVVGVDSAGARFIESVRVVVRQVSALVALRAIPATLAIESPGGIAQIRVVGEFADGVRRNVSTAAGWVSENVQVTTVSAEGLVRGVAPGASSIAVDYLGFTATVPVTVGIFEVRGDLDGDGDVDRRDVRILRQALKGVDRDDDASDSDDDLQRDARLATTGPSDPRDLNGDGFISRADLVILRSLCSRALCAAR